MPGLSSKLRWCSVAVVLVGMAVLMLQQATFGQKEDAAAATPKMHWGHVSSSHNMAVLRTRVPSGWFVSIGGGPTAGEARSTFYYYDPEHVWDGTSQAN